MVRLTIMFNYVFRAPKLSAILKNNFFNGLAYSAVQHMFSEVFGVEKFISDIDLMI